MGSLLPPSKVIEDITNASCAAERKLAFKAISGRLASTTINKLKAKIFSSITKNLALEFNVQELLKSHD